MNTAIVVPAAPHYPNRQGKKQPWFGRIFRGIQIARELDAPLIIVGDANGGADVELFTQLASVSKVTAFTELNGTSNELKNTRGDMRAAARALQSHNELHDVDKLILVTCWYHCMRSTVELQHAMAETLPDRKYSYRTVPVWDKLAHGVHRILHPNGEIRGTIEALLGRPHTPRGIFTRYGKPDITK